jgi:hypothetical protein
LSTATQKLADGHESDTRALPGSMLVDDQSDPEFPSPSQTRALPPLSTAVQDVAVGQETDYGTLSLLSKL